MQRTYFGPLGQWPLPFGLLGLSPRCRSRCTPFCTIFRKFKCGIDFARHILHYFRRALSAPKILLWRIILRRTQKNREVVNLNVSKLNTCCEMHLRVKSGKLGTGFLANQLKKEYY